MAESERKGPLLIYDVESFSIVYLRLSSASRFNFGSA